MPRLSKDDYEIYMTGTKSGIMDYTIGFANEKGIEAEKEAEQGRMDGRT